MNFNKKIISKTNLSISVIIIIGILAVVNFFSYQLFYRWDLTQNKDYSISQVSKKAVSKLDDIVNIKAYFSQDLPPELVTLPQEVGDILDEYANYSNNKIRVEFIDPTNDEELEQKLMMIGIPQLQFNVFEKDKAQIVKGYLGMSIQYGDKQEVIPVIQNTANLEYQITLAIKKVTSEEIATIGFITSNGTADLSSEMNVAFQELQKLYQVRMIDLTTAEEIPSEVSTLIIASPKEQFEENQLKAINSFLMRGGSLLVLIDGVNIEEGLMANVNETGLNNLMESYGIRLNQDLVLDFSSGIVSFTLGGFLPISVNYPFWPKIVKQGFDQKNAAVAKLESLILPWVSSIELLTDKIDQNNKVSYLAQTTNKAWRQLDNFNLNPQQNFAPSGSIGKFTIAAAIFGKFNSAYPSTGSGQVSVDNARLIVVGDSDFIKDDFSQNNPNNLIFFQNIVDSLSLDEDLINIRSKSITDRPIKELSDSERVAMRYLNIFGLTVVVIAFGMIRYYLRRKSRFVDEL